MFDIYKSENIEINILNSFVVEEYVNFDLNMKLYNFCGEHSFCVSVNDIKNIINKLNKIYDQTVGEIKLCDSDSESFLCLKVESINQVSIHGQLGSEWEDNLWVFRQNVDQTIIKLLLFCLKKIIHI